MIKVINCKKKNYKRELLSFLDKRRSGKEVDTSIVPKIIKDIRKNGKKALLKYEKKFSKNTEIVPSKEKVNKAIRALNPKIKKSIDLAYNRIFKFHSLQKPKDIKYVDNLKNKLEYKHVPLQSVGIYVPANLPSTLLMNAVPAKISGVKRIVLANPKFDGKLNPAVLYAAKKVGIKEIYSMGGAQAIASLAYIQKVNKIVGPGNIYVARSKREVFGDVGTEGMVAGPSEICVLADGKTDLNQVITSMIGQAEHDVNSQCILITKDKQLVNKFNIEIKGRIEKVQRKSVVLKSLKNNGLIVFAQTDKQIIEAINEVAPEHLEINVSSHKKYLNQIYNAGSVMIGKYSPMAVSDYNVGTNHVLPTLGSSKFSSGLNSSEFYKKISHITLTKKGIEKLGESATHLAEYEDLDNHAQSIRSRMKGK
ncbi:histidinol dehydrogenase [Candidatus Pelagibacter sp.]|nr:histidinol dehydrogenase [Candidatus Pelagibacter sp.]